MKAEVLAETLGFSRNLTNIFTFLNQSDAFISNHEKESFLSCARAYDKEVSQLFTDSYLAMLCLL